MKYSLINTIIFISFSMTQLLAQNFTSKKEQVLLLELFTSEACSSCPPADKFLSSLKGKKGLWKDFIPMGQHVDYWNYLGWRDPLSKRDFTQRQRNYASKWQELKIYTPCFILNGKEWRGFFTTNKNLIFNNKKVGILKMSFKNNLITAHFIKAKNTKFTKVLKYNYAVLGFNISNYIPKGENEGKTLKHDFSVLELGSLDSKKLIANKQLNFESFKAESKTLALVVWVVDKDNLPIQATGGYIKID